MRTPGDLHEDHEEGAQAAGLHALALGQGIPYERGKGRERGEERGLRKARALKESEGRKGVEKGT